MKNMISIITPVYNGEKFIADCIQNVITQNCGDIEHIIVDGESTDNTVPIVKEFQKNYPHIFLISERDKGQSDAMNKGIKRSRGEIIGILNSDDYYEPDVLNQIQSIFRNLQEPSLLIGNCKLLDDSGQVEHINKPSDLRIEALLSLRSPFPFNPSAYFYHKSLHERIGYYDVEEHYAMDIDFLIKAIQTANVKYVDEIWGNFRHIQGTKTIRDKQSGQHFNRLISVLEKHQRSLSSWQRTQISIFRILNRLEFYIQQPREVIPMIMRKFRR